MSFSRAKVNRFNDVPYSSTSRQYNSSGKQIEGSNSVDRIEKFSNTISKFNENCSKIEKSKDKSFHQTPKVVLGRSQHVVNNSKKIPCVEDKSYKNEGLMYYYETSADIHQTISEYLIDIHRSLHSTSNTEEFYNLWKYLHIYISCFDELLSVLDDCLQDSLSSESQLNKFSSFIDNAMEYKLASEPKQCDPCKQCARYKVIAEDAKSVTRLLTDRLMKTDQQVSELHKKMEKLTRGNDCTYSEDIANIMIGDIKETKASLMNMIDILKEEFSKERAKFSVILNDKESMIASLIKRMYYYEVRVQKDAAEIAHLKSNHHKIVEDNSNTEFVLCSSKGNSINDTYTRKDTENMPLANKNDSSYHIDRLTERIIELEQQLVNTNAELSCFQNKYKEKCHEYVKITAVLQETVSTDYHYPTPNNTSYFVGGDNSSSVFNRNKTEQDILSQPKLKQIENIAVQQKSMLSMTNSYQHTSKEGKRKFHKPTGKENTTEDCSLKNV